MPSCYVYHKCLAFSTTLNIILRFIFYLYKCKYAQFMFMDSFKKAKMPFRKNPQGLREAAFYFQASLAAVCQDKEHPELRGVGIPLQQAGTPKALPVPGRPGPSSASPRSPPPEPGGQLLPWERAARRKEGSSFLHKPGKTEAGIENKNGLIQPSYLFLQIYKCSWVLCVRTCFSLNRNLKG